MTSRERLQCVLRGGIPDCVPVCPDISNMVPVRRTGKPFWDIYLYNDPPLMDAYVDAARHYGFDAFMDLFPLTFPEEAAGAAGWERFIVRRTESAITTQLCRKEAGKRTWSPTVDVFPVADPPTYGVDPAKVDLPPVPERFEPVEGVRPFDTGPAGFQRIKRRLGDQGLVGVYVTYSAALGNPDMIYHYLDNPDQHEKWARERVEAAEERFARVMAMDEKPDIICVGGSGTLVFQTMEIFRQLAFPAVKRIIDLATEAGLPTHIHSCGPERELVRVMAEETNLTVIDPLETPPMGDCDLAELKRLWGRNLTLKGNLHTTEVMLMGSPEDVARASRKAIDDAAEGGRFILSTGDQCGRDTPDANLEAMIETARTYGRT
jgi:uroporphyrinogen decarboxylase